MLPQNKIIMKQNFNYKIPLLFCRQFIIDTGCTTPYLKAPGVAQNKIAPTLTARGKPEVGPVYHGFLKRKEGFGFYLILC